jgi:hypothetical protein
MTTMEAIINLLIIVFVPLDGGSNQGLLLDGRREA